MPDDLTKLERSFVIYRQLLAQSALRIERDDSELAEWFRSAQGRLRDLTHDLGHTGSAALENFFRDVGIKRGRTAAEDFFPATDRLVELRSSLSENGGAVWRALKESIG